MDFQFYWKPFSKKQRMLLFKHLLQTSPVEWNIPFIYSSCLCTWLVHIYDLDITYNYSSEVLKQRPISVNLVAHSHKLIRSHICCCSLFQLFVFLFSTDRARKTLLLKPFHPFWQTTTIAKLSPRMLSL